MEKLRKEVGKPVGELMVPLWLFWGLLLCGYLAFQCLRAEHEWDMRKLEEEKYMLQLRLDARGGEVNLEDAPMCVSNYP